jgi:uncharacterized protein YbaR (Trm112 family)
VGVDKELLEILACPKCNQNKGERWREDRPILDSVTDRPIEDHLTYALSPHAQVMRKARTRRGRTTIDHTKLNRDKLRIARQRAAMSALEVIKNLNIAPDSPDSAELRLELEQKSKGEFGSLIRWLRECYLKS